MTRTTLRIGFSLILAAIIGVQAAAQEKKDTPPASNDSQQQNTTNDPPSNAPSQQTDQPKTDSQNSQKNSEPANTNQNQSQNNTNNSNDTQRAPADAANNRAPRDSDADRRDNQDKTQSVLKNQNRDQQNQDSREADRNQTTSDRRDSNRNVNQDFRRDFKFGQTTSRGLTVATLANTSIFYRAGLRNGDIIISYGGRPIRTQDDFTRFVVYQSGQRIPVVVWRNGRQETIYVVYEKDSGLGVSDENRDEFGAEFDPNSKDGAVIVRVQPGSPAHKAGLIANDFVVAMNGDRVLSGRAAIEIVQSLSPGQRVQVEYERHARVEVVIGEGRAASEVGSAIYETTDGPASVSVGVDTNNTQRPDSDRNGNNNDRRENRHEGRGIVPRLRN